MLGAAAHGSPHAPAGAGVSFFGETLTAGRRMAPPSGRGEPSAAQHRFGGPPQVVVRATSPKAAQRCCNGVSRCCSRVQQVLQQSATVLQQSATVPRPRAPGWRGAAAGCNPAASVTIANGMIQMGNDPNGRRVRSNAAALPVLTSAVALPVLASAVALPVLASSVALQVLASAVACCMLCVLHATNGSGACPAQQHSNSSSQHSSPQPPECPGSLRWSGERGDVRTRSAALPVRRPPT